MDHMLFVLVLFSINPLLTNSHANSKSDHYALLSFRKFITHDPLNSLANWNGNTTFCTWTGVKCSSRRQRVVELNLPSVGLEGSIAPLVGNLALELYDNQFEGVIPQELGRLTNLNKLHLYDNQLSGHIPTSLSNCTSLQELKLGQIQLVGHIPSEFGQKLADLQVLSLWGNQVSGNIPTCLSNSSKLTLLYLHVNQLSGVVPIELGKLHLLEKLYLHSNQLISGSTANLPFLTALTNCSRLQEIVLHHNQLTGVLPSAMGQLSSNLSVLSLANNFIGGKIPHEIGNLSSLTFLNLSSNLFTGSIPSSFKGLQKLERLLLDDNRLQGNIPSEIGKLKYLGLFSAGNNLLSGTIPDSLAYLSQLRKLFLHGNNYSGNIPTSLGECRNLEVLDLSHNRFSGIIPPNLAAIDISGNRLSGLIPAALESCSELAYLDLSENEFKGPIPDELGKLQSLQNMDLSRNNLSGEIPEALGNIKILQRLNLSFNNLTGEIPKTGVFKNLTAASFLGNHGLCGPWLHFPVCPTPTSLKQTKHTLLKRVMIPVVCISSFILAGSLVVGFFWASSSRRRKLINLYKGLALKLGEYPRISYQELVNATNGFNDTNLLGVGSFGSVYKGILSDGTVAAVKVLDLQNEEAPKSFISECRVLGKVRHRNFVKIITSCSNTRFKGLVLQFVSNGSLEKHLYPDGNDGGVCRLGLSERLNIAIDVAHGIEYLHYDSSVQVVHCDIKPENVLLDEDMTARVTDFGIARLACSNSMHSLSSTLALKGSVGYIAPEYGVGGEVSAKEDVYSYGVLLLEMFTRKRPINEMFVGDLDLHKWVRSAFPNRVAEVVDSCLFPNSVGREETGENEAHYKHSLVNSVLHLGLLCTNESPHDRPTTRDVVGMLDRLRASFVGSADTTRLTPTISNLVRQRNVDAGTSDSQSGSTS
eukprot:Gb_20000 [translate_table: standard]